MSRGFTYTEEEIANAVRKANGRLSAAAEVLGCTRQTIHARVNDSEALQEVVREAREARCDKAEEVIDDLLEDAESEKVRLETAKFVLSTTGKDRGYSTRQEITGAGGNPLAFSWDTEGDDDDELDGDDE